MGYICKTQEATVTRWAMRHGHRKQPANFPVLTTLHAVSAVKASIQ